MASPTSLSRKSVAAQKTFSRRRKTSRLALVELVKKRERPQGKFSSARCNRGAESIAKTARRHRHPLTGGGFYATKLAESHAEASTSLREIKRQCAQIDDSTLTEALNALEGHIQLFFDPSVDAKTRGQTKQNILFTLRANILPAIQRTSSHAPTDKFFPLELLKGTRPYIEKIAIQACGSYDLGWYDAAAGMARRLLETLIIELFEAKGLDQKIKKPDGTFHYLGLLIAVLLSETAFNIGRNTKKALPALKDLGDQSAHSRRYTARQQDLDSLKRELRVTIEELIHLTAYK